MPEDVTIGQRIAQARKLRGLTQDGLALKAYKSKSLIAQVESGHKPASPALIADVAHALSVDVTELTGQPYRGSNSQSDRVHAAVAEIRQALAYWDIAPVLQMPLRTLPELAGEVKRTRQLRMDSSYTQLCELLPRLIKELTVHVHTATGAEREQAFGLLAAAYLAVDSIAYNLGYFDLFTLAVERMAWAARQSDDPLLVPVAATRRSFVFLASGAWDGGMALMDRASRDMNSETRGDAGLSIAGSLHLRAAILAARGGHAGSAWESIGRAEDVAGRLGRDTRDYELLFGPTNTSIHGVAVAIELGDADEAVRRAEGLALPPGMSHERSSHHYIDLSRAWVWQRRWDKALECVAAAERIAPQRTRYHPMARQTVTQLLNYQRRLPEPLRGIAVRMGLSLKFHES